MDTAVQLFRRDTRLIACAIGDPSVTLLRNDTAFCLLIAEAAHQDSFSGRLYLDGVAHLRIDGPTWSYTDFESVVLFRQHGICFAQDTATGRYFHSPSVQPYRVVFITPAEFARLRYYRAEDLAYAAFEFAQLCFGSLPGFSFRLRVLEAPDDYATAADALAPSDYVFAAREP